MITAAAEPFFQLRYNQEAQRIVHGGLTANIRGAEDVKKMMLLKAMEKNADAALLPNCNWIWNEA
ncbi:hypothetical protein GCM10020331_014290 [Ectobacillus funiculus]